MKNILVICGPTASGKTSLAISIAKELINSSSLRGIPTLCRMTRQSHAINILSVDSRQIYRDLGLVTGKDVPQDLSPNIHLYGLDLISADQTMNLAEFVQYAKLIISQSVKTKTPLIIVGGTGLYLKALTQKLSNLSTPPNSILRQDLEKLSVEGLQDLLFEINPEKIISMNNSDIHNSRRLIRAIEIASSSRTRHCEFRYSEPWQSHTTSGNLVHPCHSRAGGNPSNNTALSDISFHWVGLRPDQKSHRENIHKRVLERLENGAIEEVENLIKKYPNQKLPIFTSLGVKEIIQYLNKQISRDELTEHWTSAEIDYARRQMVWFKKQPDIIWYDKSSKQLATQLVKIFQKND